jgi:hypothetical protein
MFEQVQLIKENDEAKFAVIPIEEFLFLKEILSDEEKLADYLDYLHMQRVKEEGTGRFSLQAVKEVLAQ